MGSYPSTISRNIASMRKVLVVAVVALSGWSAAQDRFSSMPGYEGYRAAQSMRRDLVVNRLRGTWTNNQEFKFTDLKGSFVFNSTTGQTTEIKATVGPNPVPTVQQTPQRGRQFDRVKSADGSMTALYRDGNMYLEKGGQEKAITTGGSVAERVRYGIASWVYGEELNQRDAMGFSPDGRYLWFYKFDDRPVKFYYLTLGQRNQQVELDTEAYPKPGTDNPIVDLMVYDVQTEKTVTVKVRPGAFNNGIGHYVYAINWMGNDLIFHRMDRRQQERDLCIANPASGEIRVVDHVENKSGWVEFGPLRDLRGNKNDGKMLVMTDDDGFDNLSWIDLKAGKRTKVTMHQADVVNMIRMDETGLWYTVADGKNPYYHQLYRANQDGSNARRLTDPEYHHTVSVSPDGKHIADTIETDSVPPSLRMLESTGKVIKDLSSSSLSEAAAKVKPVQWIKYKSFDGTTDLYMEVSLPANYRPGTKLPVLFGVYGGPIPGRAPSITYAMPDTLTGAGFAVVDVRVRGGNGRGRAFRQALYKNMGKVEIDDIAAAADALKNQPWADTKRVGIHGTSYGGYSAAMCILRYPNLFQAASASSMVSDWRNYDTTYTERYMGLLEDNKAGYDFGSAMTYAKDLKGWLLIYYGTADNNTHPSNSLQLSDALLRAGKYHEVQVGVDAGHSGVNQSRMMEFFIERLVMNPPRN